VSLAYGAVYVIMDTPSYEVEIQDIAAATITGAQVGSCFSCTLAVADIDFDSQDDLLVGAMNDGSSDEGAVYRFHGPLSGSVSAARTDIFIEGSVAGAGLGSSLSRPTDLDEDGLLDLAVGSV
jgi:hypothetical protein